MAERIVLPQRIANPLNGFSGKTVADKIDYLAKQTATLNLHECNQGISRIESRYGRVFGDFMKAWDRGEIADAQAYQTETDLIEWEALEQEKEHWLQVIRLLSRQRARSKAVSQKAMTDFETILSRTERECHGFAQEGFGVAAIIESERRSNFVEIRIHIASTIFIEVDHNAQNGRASDAQSQDPQRIFGYDGVTTWHRHPLHHPEKHEPCA